MFDRRKPEPVDVNDEKNFSGLWAEIDSDIAANRAPSSTVPRGRSPTPAEARRQQQHRAWSRRRQDGQHQREGPANQDADRGPGQDPDSQDVSMVDGYEVDTPEEAWQERGEGDWVEAAGFGSFGGGGGGLRAGGGSVGESYDGLALDRLMGVMAVARTLKLTRLQVEYNYSLFTPRNGVQYAECWLIKACTSLPTIELSLESS